MMLHLHKRATGQEIMIQESELFKADAGQKA